MMQKMPLVLDSDKYTLVESYSITVNGVVYMKGSNTPLKTYNSDKGKVVKLKVCKYDMIDGIVYYDKYAIEKEYKISRYCIKHYISNTQIIYLLKESGYIKEINKRFFKERYVMKIVNKLRAEVWKEKNDVDMH